MTHRTILGVMLLLAVVSHRSAAQAPPSGRITGRVIDAATGHALHDVVVQVVGTTLGGATNVDGRYRLQGVVPGTVTLYFRRIGYAAKTVTGLMLAPGSNLEQDVALPPASAALAEIVVTASAERGTINESVDQQRTATGVVNSITAEQIAKSPDGNAAQAVQRVSGVTVTDGRYIAVRGLGERYTTSSLNGARVPSPEPEKRMVPLDLFPAGLVQSITTSKTFTPDQQGDFSGAQVDIKTREFPARRSWSLNLGSGYESDATGASILSPGTSGGEGMAMVNHGRDLPSLVASVGNFAGRTLSQGDKNLLVSQFRNSWMPTAATGAPLVNGSFSFGGNDPLLFGHRLGYLVSATISSSTDRKNNQVRALADRGPVRGETIELDKFTGESAQQSVLWGGLANLSTMIGNGSRLSINALYNRTADNTARIETGYLSANDNRARITRMQYVERAVHSLQLAGDHQFGDRHHVEWAGTVSGVRRSEPDKSEFVQVIERDTPAGPDVLRWFGSGNGGAVRTFSELVENSRELSAKYTLAFGDAGRQSTIKIGTLLRSTDRSADNRAFNINGRGLSNATRELSPEQLFDGRFTQATSAVFDIGPLSQGGAYDAHDQLSATFAMAEVPISARLRVIGGARYELDHLGVNATSTLGRSVSTRKVWADVLPSLAVNYKLTETQQLRLAASRTLARPEYRELSPIISRDVVGGDDLQGDENLQRTNVTNVDVRWEWYPNAGELISVAVFGKQFTNPIERVYRASSSARQVLYANAERADNFGVELEARKELGFLGRPLAPFAVFSNVTVMSSQIHLSAAAGASLTNLSRRMVGQAPYVINGGLTYTSNRGSSTATLLFNRVGERIDVAGESPLPDVVIKPRNVMDLSLRLGVTAAVTIRADVRNLLDAPYETMQGTVTRERYLAGRTIQAGVQFRP